MAKRSKSTFREYKVNVHAISFCRITKQAVTAEVSILGGITFKVPLPSDADALTDFLHKNDLELPSGPLTTIYRIEFKGTVYFCRSYKRVKKRNSYTVLYLDDGQEKFAIIEYFVFIHHKVIALLKPLLPISITCKDHFNVSSTVLDSVLVLTPIVKSNVVKCCFVGSFIKKCLFIDFNSVQYVCQFPYSVFFD